MTEEARTTVEVPNRLGLHARAAAKLVDVISLLREYDLQSKGWGGNARGSGALMKEMVFKIMHR